MSRIFIFRILVSCALLVLLITLSTDNREHFVASVHHLFGGHNCSKDFMCVSFLDVGQGDAIFIESPTGIQVLIDGGPDSAVLRELSQSVGFFDRDIDMVIATHPDKDHIGGLTDVLKRYNISQVLITENKHDTPVAELFSELVLHEDAQVIYARSGQRIDLGGGAQLEVLFPDRDPTTLESNLSSIILRLVYGETKVLMTGDSPKAIEHYLVKLHGSTLQSDVLKVGHHGSKTSTAATFVAAVAPDYAIISAGRDNRYGHPHQEVLTILKELDMTIKNTATEGSIFMISDGENFFFK